MVQRNTKQRQVILEELRKVDNHPSASEVYELVRLRLPRISLGTVYRNLETLVRSGKIHKVESGGGQARFDGKTEAHFHIRCVSCDSLTDVPVSKSTLTVASSTETLQEHLILGVNAEYAGICPVCRDQISPDDRARLWREWGSAPPRKPEDQPGN
jgi:Fur family transcriptional regulator, peroxide stress response regulator